jgi:sulfur carrier protein
MSLFVTVNGQEREVEADATLASLVESLGTPGGGRGVAVALDGEVIPRGEWSDTALRAGARIEVVVAVQGG